MNLYKLEGWLSDAEGDKLRELAQLVPDGQCIVELGSYRGKSSCFLADGSLAGNRVPVHCVDLWEIGGQWEDAQPRRHGEPLHQSDPSHHDVFRATTAPYAAVIVEHNASTLDVAASWDGGPVGLLFVDADHRYESTLADLQAWEPHFAPGAMVAIHDYGNRDYPDVRRATLDWLGQHVDSMLVVQR